MKNPRSTRDPAPPTAPPPPTSPTQPEVAAEHPALEHSPASPNAPEARRGEAQRNAASLVGRDEAPSRVAAESPPPSNQPAPPRSQAQKIAMVGNHTPRRCGIATFTADLIEAISDHSSELDGFVLAMNAAGHRPDYPPRVRFEISEGDIRSYHQAADFLNVNGVGVVSLQHEYGIFGGTCGSHVLELLCSLRMPVVTTLHTILSEPSAPQRAVMNEILRLSERLVVMSASGAKLLRRVHDVPEAKIDLIPHGIPHLPDSRASKEQVGVQGNRVILTFGLLSPDKGIEHVIDALPEILERFPNAIYIIVGATHPHVKDREGESYRIMLAARARNLRVDTHVVFYNRFVTHEELTTFLSAADVYVTPYLNTEQITSGTLAYAVGSGKAVISTPYPYARELLAEGRGTLVPLRDSAAIARATIELFGDDERRISIGQRAATYGHEMAWPAVARAYVRSFDRARQDSSRRVRLGFQAKTLASRGAELPELSLDHLSAMTDDTGLLQHASFEIPRYEDGYCLDDNARALIVMTLAANTGTEDSRLVRSLTSRYSAFVRYAWNPRIGRFRNFMSYERKWMEERGSEDSHGRALWALGTVVGRASDSGRRSLCASLFQSALLAVPTFTSPRAWAFSLLGIDEYLGAFQGDSAVGSLMEVLSERLLELYRRTNEAGWRWFEDSLTYCNARLSQALLVAGTRLNREDLLEAGLASLDWLVSVQTSADGYFAPVGSDGFYVKGRPKSRFDQQPIEASATIAACLDALDATGDARWATRARHAFDWYLGQNDLQQPVYNALTGGCHDGLARERVNRNQGAEATLSFLLSVLELREPSRRAARLELLCLPPSPATVEN